MKSNVAPCSHDATELSIGRTRIPSLDGLRAISIILVLMGHGIRGRPRSFAFRTLFLHADLGVSVFFIISGFLITSLLLNERLESGNISLGLFYIRRGLRILPAFFLFVGCVAILSGLRLVPVPPRFWLYVVTYTVNFAPQYPWVLGHLWSLCVEEQFYLLWPLAVKLATPRMCTALALFAIFANPATHAVEQLTHVHLATSAFPFVCGPIAMGCLLAMWSRRVQSAIISSNFLSNDRILLLALALIAMLDSAIQYAQHFFLRIILNGVLTLCVARLIFLPTGVAGRVLNSRPVVLIGKLSYSLYLWQQLFLNFTSSATIPIPFPGNFVATFAAASACYWGLEVRFLVLRKKFRKVSQPGKVLQPA